MPVFANWGQILQILIAFAALIIAAKKAYPTMSENNFFSAGAVLFYLLVALVFVSVWLLVSREGVPQPVVTSDAQFPKWPDPYRPISVINQTFRNTEVLLDGYSYDHCTFENVTFVYNGTTPPQIVFPDIKGPVRYKTNNPAIGGIAGVFRAFGDLPNVNVEFSNPNNILRAPGEPVE